MKRAIVFLLVLPLFLVSCVTQNLFVKQKRNQDKEQAAIDSAFGFNPNYEYKIKKDDKISISVWGQDELSVGSVYGIYNSNSVYGKWLLVDINGNIELPKVGTFHVMNQTTASLKDSLRNLYKQWLVNPIVDVKVVNKEITVLGEVRTPSVIQLDEDQNSLIKIITKAGGFEFYANLKKIKILRQEGENVRIATINLTDNNNKNLANLQLQPGDVVIVPSKSYKEFDKRISIIVPFTSTATAIAVLFKTF